MTHTILNLHDELNLTCTRKGTCCHGNQVLLNPWELHRLAHQKGIPVRDFRNLFCDWSGIRLKFDGKKDNRGKSACSQYIPDFGCSLHEGRPLACRLFPIGRQIQNEKVQYIFQGETFPCLNGCPEVNELPKMSIENYLIDQKTSLFEQAQDAYLELMQNIADIAFMLLLDTGLAASGDTKTVAMWKEVSFETPEKLFGRIGKTWVDYLTLPLCNHLIENPTEFAAEHQLFLQEKAQEQINGLTSLTETSELSIFMMSLAYFLAYSIGASPIAMGEIWVEIAIQNGAKNEF